jgi:hypothetical protein
LYFFGTYKKEILYQARFKQEIMRQAMVVLGFSLIVLIFIAGCSSPQNAASTGSKGQTTNVESTVVSSQTSPPPCDLPSVDPIRFQKFLPDVPGYDRRYGQNISINPDSLTESGIFDIYTISDTSNLNQMIVSFSDMGPCVTDSTGVTAAMNRYSPGKTGDRTTTRINNFHGYPAIRNSYGESTISYREIIIGINNRISVTLTSNAVNTYTLSETGADAEFEKFANAIDFNGVASLVK